MALEEENITVPFVAGIETGIDPKLVPSPALLRAENVEIVKRGKLQKRSILSSLTAGIIGIADSLSSIYALRTFGNELLGFCLSYIYSYSSSITKWIPKGSLIPVSVKLKDIIKNTYSQNSGDVAINGSLGAGTIAVVTWDDSRGGSYGSIYDTVSETFLVAEQSLDASGVRPRALGFTTGWTTPVVTYGNSTNLKGRLVSLSSGASFGSAVNIVTDLNSANPVYDICDVQSSSFFLLAYNVQGASQIKLCKVNQSLAVTATITINEASDTCISVFWSVGYYYVAWYSGSKVRCTIIDASTFTTAVSPFDVETIANVVRITGAVTGQTPFTSGTLIYEISAAAKSDYYCRTVVITSAGSVGTIYDLMRSCGIASKPFATIAAGSASGGTGTVFPNVDGYAVLVHESTLQNTYFIVRLDQNGQAEVAARFCYGVAGGIRTTFQMTGNGQIGSTYYLALSTKSQRKTTNLSGLQGSGESLELSPPFLSEKGMTLVAINFNDQPAIDGRRIGKELILTGGRVTSYDGIGATEQGFNLFPEDVTAAQTTGGSMSSTALYSYQVCYEWTDAGGQLVRSCPSVPVSIQMTGSNTKVNLTVPTLRLTAKRNTAVPSRTNVQIVAYRNEDNGSVYYRAGSLTVPVYNNKDVDSVTFPDTIADSDLIAREPLYTEGGELENIPAPPAKFIAFSKDRIVLAGTDDGAIWPSKIRLQGKPVEFNDQLIMTPGAEGGDITGIAAMDDKVILFRQRRTEYYSGDGPNNLGQNGQFSPINLLWGDIGCQNARSIVEFPLGVLFQSYKGFYVITRGLGLVYIGGPVKNWDNITVTRATLNLDKNQIRITTSDASGVCLVLYYDPRVDINAVDASHFAWTTFTGYSSVDSALCNGTFYLADSSTVYQESAGSFSSAVTQKVTTPWINLGEIAGFQRVWEIAVLGAYRSAHVLTVKIGYDYSPAWTQTLTFNPASASGIVAVGDSDYYGIGSFSGDSSAIEIVKFTPARQKCTAIRIEISDGSLSGTNEGLSLSAVQFKIGKKKGLNKLRSAQTA